MTVRENLIPDDQPYGERQATRQAMQQAGQPTSTGVTRPAMPGPSASGVGEPDLFEGATPTRPLLDMPSPRMPVDPMAGLAEIAATSRNTFVREVIGRILGAQ